jgi:hypothetical protein
MNRPPPSPQGFEHRGESVDLIHRKPLYGDGSDFAALILSISRGIIAMMIKLIIMICCGLLVCSCTAPGQVSVNTPQGARENYPVTFEDSAERQQAVQDAWKSFLSDLGLPYSKLDLEPVLNTPRSLPPMLAGQISITTRSGAFGEMEAKEALRGFIVRTRHVLCGDPKNCSFNVKDLSLISFSNDGNFYRAVYQQVTYPFPIANGYGELKLTVDKKAMLLQWSSRLLPTLELPTIPEVKPQELVERLMNREFTYTTFAGQPQTYKVTRSEEIKVGDLVIYPRQEGNRISMHLAYPVEMGSGMTWTVFIDAINGRELGVKQNFAT